MSRFITALSIATITLGAPVIASAHPHKDAPERVEKSATDFDRAFDKHAKSLQEALDTLSTDSRVIVKKYKRSDDSSNHDHDHTSGETRVEIIKDPEALRETAREIETMIAESGFLSSLADMVIGLADDIEITDTRDGIKLGFDGNTLGRIESRNDDTLSLEGFGKSTTIERESFIENGKRKTRIIIETDEDTDVKVKAEKRAPNEF